MKEFMDVVFDTAACQRELTALAKLLKSKSRISERQHIQPFFRKSQQLSAFLSTFTPNVGPVRLLAYELPLFGNFAADIVLGNREHGEYCLVELEDGSSDGVLTKVRNKATKEWGRRFEHGFSQLVDWFYALDDLKKTSTFASLFGYGHVKFFGLLVAGRSADLTEDDRIRLRWRAEKVLVDSHPVSCVTFGDVHHVLQGRLDFFKTIKSS